MFFDTHIHSSYSEDADTAPEDIIKEAKARGLSGIIFTDHFDLDYPGYEDRWQIDYDSYFPAMEALKQKSDTPDFTMGIGIEMGLQPQVIKQNKAVLDKYPFDYCIGSIHIVDRRDPYLDEFFEGHDVKRLIERVMAVTLENITHSSYFDSLGHLDYTLRYANRYLRSKNLPEISLWNDGLVEEILLYLIKNDKCLEINTGAFRSGLTEPNPNYSIIEKYFALGGRLITLGSDAHETKHLGLEFEKVTLRLKDIGFTCYNVFTKRIPRQIPL